MFDNTNPYILRKETAEGTSRYYVSFTDGQNTPHTTEVSRRVYREFLRFAKVERNLRRWDERHLEQSDLTDETLYDRAFRPQKSLEEVVTDSERSELLCNAVKSLSETQRRRFVLYHEFGHTYEQIADVEGCSAQAVAKTVTTAEKKIRKFFEKQG